MAWEYCFPRGGDPLPPNVVRSATPNIPGLDTKAWLIKDDRYVWRVYGSQPNAELVYGLRSPADAARAEAEQRARCAQSGCAGLIDGAVEGAVVRFTLAASLD